METIKTVLTDITQQPFFKPVLYGTIATLAGLILYKRYG